MYPQMLAQIILIMTFNKTNIPQIIEKGIIVIYCLFTQ